MDRAGRRATRRAGSGRYSSVSQVAPQPPASGGALVSLSLVLADRLKLVAPEGRPAEQELKDLLGGLSQDELREYEKKKGYRF